MPRLSGLWILSALFLLLLSFNASSSPVPEENREKSFELFNTRLGSAGVQADYKFTPYTSLVELAQLQVNMGSDALKFTLPYVNDKNSYQNTYPDLKTLPPEQCGSIVDIIKHTPEYDTVFNLPLRFYVMYAYASGVPYYNCIVEGYSGTPHAREEYRQLYELTTYLMTKYQNTGKVFLLGQWEGDWPLRFGQGGRSMLNPSKLRGTIEWYNNRFKAVDDARTALSHLKGVGVYHYEEVNVLETIINEPEVESSVNTILSEAKVDLVSYSAYNATNYTYELPGRLHRHLDRVLKMTNFSGKWPYGKPVFIGEYNIVYEPNGRIRADKVNAATMAASSWGCPLIMFWMSYAGIYRVDWDTAALVDPDGTPTEEYRDQQDFMGKLLMLKNASRVWLDRNPTDDEVNSLSAVLDRTSGVDIVSSIVNSPELTKKYSDQRFIEIMFQNMFTSQSTQSALFQRLSTQLTSGVKTRWQVMLALLDSEEFRNEVSLDDYLKYMDRHLVRFPRPQKYEHDPSHHFCEALNGRAFLLQELALRKVDQVNDKIFRRYMPYVRKEIAIDQPTRYEWPDSPMYASQRSFWQKPAGRGQSGDVQTFTDGYTSRPVRFSVQSAGTSTPLRVEYSRPPVTGKIIPALILVNYPWDAGRYHSSLEVARALQIPVLAVDTQLAGDDDREAPAFFTGVASATTPETLRQSRPARVVDSLREAWNFLEGESDIDESKTVLYGFGWGGVYASLATGTDTRIKNLITSRGVGGFTSSQTRYAQSISELPEFARDAVLRFFDPITFAPFAYARTSILTGSHDPSFPWQNVQNQYIAFRNEGAKLMFVAPNVGDSGINQWTTNLDDINTHVLRMHLFDEHPLPTLPANAIWRHGEGRYTWASSGGSHVDQQQSYFCWSPGRVPERSRYWKVLPGDRALSRLATGLPEKSSANWGVQLPANLRQLKAEAYIIVTDGPGRVVSSLPTLLPGAVDPSQTPGTLWDKDMLWDVQAGAAAWRALDAPHNGRISSSGASSIQIAPNADGHFAVITNSIILSSGAAQRHRGITIQMNGNGGTRELEVTLRRDAGQFEFESYSTSVSLPVGQATFDLPWDRFTPVGNAPGLVWPYDSLIVRSTTAASEPCTIGAVRFME